MPERNPGWRPGYRRVPPGQRQKFGEEVFMISTIGRLQIMGVTSKQEEAEDPFGQGLTPDTHGKEVALLFKFDSGKRSFPISLTQLNEKELETLWTVLSEAFEHARPIVAERDRIAEEAAANGDDTYFRRHRVDPKISRFPGKF